MQYTTQGRVSSTDDRRGCASRSAAALVASAAGSAPPSGNTGAQTALVDWLGATFHDEPLSKVLERFGCGWVPLPCGANGYKQGMARGHVKVYFDGQEGMGIHVEISGQGCRQLEGEEVVTDWSAFLRSLLNAGALFSRIDVALDDFSGLLDLDRMREYIESGRVVSRYRRAKPLWEHSLQTGEAVGKSLYFGSASSDTRIRIYDKRLEQFNSAAHPRWVRVELQARDDSAQALASILADGGTGLEAVAQVIRGKLEFKEVGNAQQRERWQTAGWWSAFLEGCGKLSLSLAPVVRTVEKVYAWVQRQVAPSLALLVAAVGGDIDVLLRLASEGRDRWRPWHRRLLEGAACG